mmetsp:Transcript_99504/g.264459  ORF Transcript_99504/g.264459 Transcript_99504/m.264459 type:complete len:278 (-) Transcript_99504:377-1210(-)
MAARRRGRSLTPCPRSSSSGWPRHASRKAGGRQPRRSASASRASRWKRNRGLGGLTRQHRPPTGLQRTLQQETFRQLLSVRSLQSCALGGGVGAASAILERATTSSARICLLACGRAPYPQIAQAATPQRARRRLRRPPKLMVCGRRRRRRRAAEPRTGPRKGALPKAEARRPAPELLRPRAAPSGRGPGPRRPPAPPRAPPAAARRQRRQDRRRGSLPAICWCGASRKRQRVSRPFGRPGVARKTPRGLPRRFRSWSGWSATLTYRCSVSRASGKS